MATVANLVNIHTWHSPARLVSIHFHFVLSLLGGEIQHRSQYGDAYMTGMLFTLGAEVVLPGGYIENLLRVFKQFTHT